MSNITEWIKYELYPSLFEVIDIAFPEHNFKQSSRGWHSKTYLDGSNHPKRTDKTVVTKKAIGTILEQGGEVIGLVDYVIKRDGVDFITAVKTLSSVVGLQPPTNTDFNKKDYVEYRNKATILEDCNNYFVYCFEHSKGAQEIKDYLINRGYSSADIKAMELGYIPSQEQLYKYLKGVKKHSEELVDKVVKLNKLIGSTHKLTIPYRSGEIIKGFKFRTVGDQTPKYLNSTGLDRIGGFFNLSAIKGNKDVVIVEGELDSLHASCKGVNNIVATGGSSISSEQIQDAIKRGAKTFTLCFDKEPNKEPETYKKVISSIDIILKEGLNRVYVSTLPDLGGDKTDPDKLLKEEGVEPFKRAINEAIPYYEYQLQNILFKYGEIEEQRGENGLTPKDVDTLLDNVVETATAIKDATDRDRYKKIFTSLDGIKELGITEESLSITLDRLTTSKDKDSQEKNFRKLISEATQLQTKGDTSKAIELIENRLKEVKIQDKATEFSSLLKTPTESEIRERQISKPESVKSGYSIGGEPLLLPSGAISIISAPTSHGKTTFLINLALNVLKEYQNKSVYLFSYEEDSDSILTSSLNTYLDDELASNNRGRIKEYFATGSTSNMIKEHVEYFKKTKDKFFKELVEPKKLNIHYCNYDSDTLIDAIRYIHKNTNVGAVFIDYIQLLNLPKGKYKTYSRQEEIKAICQDLKDVSVDTGLPIILGAQYNRTVTNHLHLHPTKIGEAGDIERIANLILGFWNNFHKTTGAEGELNDISKKGLDAPNTIYTEILKNRGGKVGGYELLDYNGNKGTIKNGNTSKEKLF